MHSGCPLSKVGVVSASLAYKNKGNSHPQLAMPSEKGGL